MTARLLHIFHRLPRTLSVSCAAFALVICAAAAPAAAAQWVPPQQLTWYWQLTGTVDNSQTAAAFDIDGFDNDASEVSTLHAAGKRVICYIDVGTAENWRPDYSQFPSAILGNTNGWPGERWINVSPSSGYYSQLQSIITARLQMCKQKGFDALEPDNMDGWENNTGFPTTAQEQLSYNEWVAGEAHSLGLAVLQKNDPEQAATLQPYFDGILDEQCNQYSECNLLAPYVAAGKPALDAEYQSSRYPAFCTPDNAEGLMGALYSTALDGTTYKPCWSGSGAGSPPPTGSPAPPASGGSPAPPSGSSSAPVNPLEPSSNGTSAGGSEAAGTASVQSLTVDRTAPRVALGAGALTARKGTVRLRLSCPRGQSFCDGIVALDGAASFRGLLLGRAYFHIAGGASTTVRIGLLKKALHKVAGIGSLPVVITVTAHDLAQRRGTSRRRATLHLGPARR